MTSEHTGQVRMSDKTGDPQFDHSLEDVIWRCPKRHRLLRVFRIRAGWGEVRKLKTAAGYNTSLVGAGTTDATRMLLSVPLVVNAQMPPYTGLIIDRTAVVTAVGAVQVAVSEHAYFTTQDVGLRCTWRFGHSVTRPERLGKFTVAGGGS